MQGQPGFWVLTPLKLTSGGVVLVQRGWVVRDGRKYITATDKARDELMALTESGLRYLAELRESFTQLPDA